MVQKSGDHQLIGSWNPIIYRILYIPSGLALGFLNHPRGGVIYSLFSPLPGEMIQID